MQAQGGVLLLKTVLSLLSADFFVFFFCSFLQCTILIHLRPLPPQTPLPLTKSATDLPGGRVETRKQLAHLLNTSFIQLRLAVSIGMRKPLFSPMTVSYAKTKAGEIASMGLKTHE